MSIASRLPWVLLLAVGVVKGEIIQLWQLKVTQAGVAFAPNTSVFVSSNDDPLILAKITFYTDTFNKTALELSQAVETDGSKTALISATETIRLRVADDAQLNGMKGLVYYILQEDRKNMDFGFKVHDIVDKNVVFSSRTIFLTYVFFPLYSSDPSGPPYSAVLSQFSFPTTTTVLIAFGEPNKGEPALSNYQNLLFNGSLNNGIQTTEPFSLPVQSFYVRSSGGNALFVLCRGYIMTTWTHSSATQSAFVSRDYPDTVKSVSESTNVLFDNPSLKNFTCIFSVGYKYLDSLNITLAAASGHTETYTLTRASAPGNVKLQFPLQRLIFNGKGAYALQYAIQAPLDQSTPTPPTTTLSGLETTTRDATAPRLLAAVLTALIAFLS